MKRVEGSAGVSLLECVNPVKNKWRVRWDVQPSEQVSKREMLPIWKRSSLISLPVRR